MKGMILPDHIPVNNYELIVVGGPPILTFVTFDGIPEELETVDLPDRTVASGGNTKSFETAATHPTHHAVENAYLEAWFLAAQNGVPGYKRAATLLKKSVSGLVTKSYNLIGMFPSMRETADQEMENEGDLDVTAWTFKGDRIIVL